MLNTGSALSHRCESTYNRYRCFLIANQGAKNSALEVRKKVIEKQGSLPVKVPEGYFADAYWARYYVNQTKSNIGNDCKLLDASVSGNYYPKRHCGNCAEMAFHSFVFDLPWVSHCPVHKVELRSTCPACKKPWPSLNTLRKQNCKCCGASIKFRNLAQLRLCKPSSTLDIFDSHQNLIDTVIPDLMPEVNIRHEPVFLTRTEKGQDLSTSYDYFRTSTPNVFDWFSIFALDYFDRLPKAISEYLQFTGYGAHSVEAETFRWDNADEITSKRRARKIWHKGISIAAEELRYALQSQMGPGHKLGECKKRFDACFLCTSWYAWSEKVHYEQDTSKHNYFGFKHDLMKHMLQDRPSLKLELANEIASNGGQYSKTNWSPMRPPENIQVRLIYLDAIDLFIRIHIISMAKRISSYRSKRNTAIDLASYIPSSVKNSGISLLPRKICNVDNEWSLVWPKLNLRATLADPIYYWCKHDKGFT